jgi:DNA-binding MarR family transcriptional regulator
MVFYKEQNYSAQVSVGYLMRRIVSLLAQELDHAMEPHGLTNAQWFPLLKLSQGQAHTAAELARCCELDASAITRLLDRLEDKALCQRVRSSEDRRVVNLALTEEGQKAAAVIPGVLCQVQNRLLSGFSEGEWQLLTGLLQRLLDNAQREFVLPVPGVASTFSTSMLDTDLDFKGKK